MTPPTRSRCERSYILLPLKSAGFAGRIVLDLWNMRVWPMLLNLRRLILAVRGRLAQQRSTNRCGRDSVGLQGYWAVPKRQRAIHHQMWGFLTVKTRLQASSRKFSTSLRSAVDLPCLNEEWASLSSLMAWSFDSPSGRSLARAKDDLRANKIAP